MQWTRPQDRGRGVICSAHSAVTLECETFQWLFLQFAVIGACFVLPCCACEGQSYVLKLKGHPGVHNTRRCILQGYLLFGKELNIDCLPLRCVLLCWLYFTVLSIHSNIWAREVPAASVLHLHMWLKKTSPAQTFLTAAVKQQASNKTNHVHVLARSLYLSFAVCVPGARGSLVCLMISCLQYRKSLLESISK